MGSMSGKTAVVTGGSRGIGRAICLELARRGANVVFSYAGNTAAAEKTLEELKALGVEARAVQGNVADPAAAKTLIDTAVKELGGIHILVNNAGITRDGLAMAMKEEDFDAVIETNLKGAFLCMKAAIRPMMKARYGRIVNMSSVVALRGNPGQVNYCASKAGLIGMTKSLAKEMGARGITVNAVAPAYISTDMTAALPAAPRPAMLSAIPVGRAGNPEHAVVALLGNPGQVNCCASKAGLIRMTKSLAKEVGARGITVSAVAPGYISTDMTAALPDAARQAMLSTIPVGRAGNPEDVAAAVAFLASEEAGYITGQVLSVDGGMGM